MKEQSLHQIMNDMVKRLDTLRPMDQVSSAAPEALSELEAFLRVDSLLSSLNREYLEAKTQRRELSKLYGAGDAMTEVAIDMEDSAWCAMQTRYMELRKNGKLMEQAQRLMRRSETMEKEFREKEIAREKEKDVQTYIYWVRLMDKVKEKNKTPAIFEWLLVLYLCRAIPYYNPKSRDYVPSAIAA